MIASPPTPTRRWSAAALLASPALALALSACGTDAPPTGTSDGASASSPAAAEGVSGTDVDAARDAYDLRLAECMRGRGLDIADPAPGAGITESGPEVSAAASACMAEIGDPPVHEWTEAELAALHEEYLAMAECYRELGYDTPDPAPGEAITVPDGMSDAEFASCEKAGR